jgi:hypothetical protein
MTKSLLSLRSRDNLSLSIGLHGAMGILGVGTRDLIIGKKKEKKGKSEHRKRESRSTVQVLQRLR